MRPARQRSVVRYEARAQPPRRRTQGLLKNTPLARLKGRELRTTQWLGTTGRMRQRLQIIGPTFFYDIAAEQDQFGVRLKCASFHLGRSIENRRL